MAVFDRPLCGERARYIIRVSSPKPAKEGKCRGSFGKKNLSEQERGKETKEGPATLPWTRSNNQTPWLKRPSPSRGGIMHELAPLARPPWPGLLKEEAVCTNGRFCFPKDEEEGCFFRRKVSPLYFHETKQSSGCTKLRFSVFEARPLRYNRTKRDNLTSI